MLGRVLSILHGLVRAAYGIWIIITAIASEESEARRSWVTAHAHTVGEEVRFKPRQPGPEVMLLDVQVTRK